MIKYRQLVAVVIFKQLKWLPILTFNLYFFYIFFNSNQQPKVLYNIEHTSPPISIFIIAWLYHLIS